MKLTVKQKFCASSWLIIEINILRCTVSKTSKNIKYFKYMYICYAFVGLDNEMFKIHGTYIKIDISY